MAANAQVVDSLDEVGKYEPLGIRVGVSLNNVLRTLARTNDTHYSFQADAIFGRYMMVAEYGHAEIRRNNDQQESQNLYQYASNGWFFRVGPEVNLLVNRAKTSFRADGDIIFFGLRFGRAQVTDAMILLTRDDAVSPLTGENNYFWEPQAITVRSNRLGVTWLEMTAGMKVQLYGNFFLGYNLRFKFGRNFAGDQSLIPYEVPGFGKGENRESFRFDYYLAYRIPFRR